MIDYQKKVRDALMEMAFPLTDMPLGWGRGMAVELAAKLMRERDENAAALATAHEALSQVRMEAGRLLIENSNLKTEVDAIKEDWQNIKCRLASATAGLRAMATLLQANRAFPLSVDALNRILAKLPQETMADIERRILEDAVDRVDQGSWHFGPITKWVSFPHLHGAIMGKYANAEGLFLPPHAATLKVLSEMTAASEKVSQILMAHTRDGSGSRKCMVCLSIDSHQPGCQVDAFMNSLEASKRCLGWSPQ